MTRLLPILCLLLIACGDDDPPAAERPVPRRQAPAADDRTDYERRMEELSLYWPPDRARLAGVIPDYDALEATLVGALEADRIDHETGELHVKIGQRWNSFHGDSGSTPSNEFRAAMRDHDFDVERQRVADDEPERAFRVRFAGGRWGFPPEAPTDPEGIDQVWARVDFRGNVDRGVLIEIGARLPTWVRMKWCDRLGRFVHRTLDERDAFRAAYRRRLEDEIRELRAQEGPRREFEKRLPFLVDAYVHEFRWRYLVVFLDQTIDRIAWPE